MAPGAPVPARTPGRGARLHHQMRGVRLIGRPTGRRACQSQRGGRHGLCLHQRGTQGALAASGGEHAAQAGVGWAERPADSAEPG